MGVTCHELAARIEQLQPTALPCDVARLCLLLTNYIDDLETLDNEQSLAKVWQEMGMRLQAATDQHAAVTEELEKMAKSDPANFTMEQIWTLIRAVRVQSQILELYIGETTIEN